MALGKVTRATDKLALLLPNEKSDEGKKGEDRDGMEGGGWESKENF